MPTKGTYTALQKLKPIDTDFGQIAREEEASAIAKEQREYERAQARRQEKRDISKGFAQDYSTLGDVITGTQSINEAFARGVGKARDMMGEMFGQAHNNPAVEDSPEFATKRQGLRQFSSSLKTVSDRYTTFASEVSSGLADGSLSGWMDDTLNDLDSIFVQANLDVAPDPKTGHPMGMIAKIDPETGEPLLDEDGDVVLEKLNLIEVLDGRGLSEKVPFYDLTKQAREIGSKLGDDEITSLGSDFSSKTVQSFSSIEDRVRSTVKGIIGTAKNPSPVAKSIWVDFTGGSAKELTEADMKTIEDRYVNDISLYYDEKIGKSIDYAARQRAEDAAKEEDLKGIRGVTVNTNENEEPMTKNMKGILGVTPGEATSFSVPAGLKVNIEGGDMEIDNLYLNDAGQVIYEGYENIGKVSEDGPSASGRAMQKQTVNLTRKRIEGGLRTSVLNDIALALTARYPELKLENAGDLKSYLEETKKGFDSKGKTTKKKGILD